MSNPDCIFCRIISGAIPAQFLYRSERVVAFNDLAPQAPVHILIVPVSHHENIGESAVADSSVVGELFSAAQQLATAQGISDYRTVANTGAGAGQSVFHTHLHLLAGRAFAWPPG
jgi:histidine triad (HIT) family protein